jgi:hypothetical protein
MVMQAGNKAGKIKCATTWQQPAGRGFVFDFVCSTRQRPITELREEQEFAGNVAQILGSAARPHKVQHVHIQSD